MHQIVCLSTTNFHPLPTRKQNVMTRLRESEILYFDPPVSYLAPLKDPKARARLRAWRQSGQRVQDNLTIYATPPVLPFFNRFRWINRLNQRRQARFVRKKMKQHGFDKPVLWCYSPTACDIVGRVEHRALVYDCVDRHSGYGGQMNPALVDRMERELAQKADQVFATAIGLQERLAQVNPTAKLIPNGAAYEIFSQVQKQELPCPQEMRDLPRPIFGFVGMLQECIDYDWMERLARQMPQATLYLIGRTLPGVDISALAALPNVVVHELVPQPQLPAYLQQFDVCLNLFRKGSLSRDVSPLKFYEYLATGKPVVSTEEPLQVADFEDVVTICRREEEFVEACRRAAGESDPDKVEKRLRYAKECSWDARVRQMEQTLRQRGLW